MYYEIKKSVYQGASYMVTYDGRNIYLGSLRACQNYVSSYNNLLEGTGKKTTYING